MKLSFLNHSGFLLDDGHRAYVFDYFKDPAGLVKKRRLKAASFGSLQLIFTAIIIRRAF